MTTRTILIAGGLLVASIGPALSDRVTAMVISWNAAGRTLTLHDKSQFADIPATVTVPADIKEGDEVTVEFEGSENGIEAINRIDIIRDIARRQLPAPAKRT